MKLAIGTALLLFAFSPTGGQTKATSKQVSGEETAAALPPKPYSVIGATPKQEALLRTQIRIMQPEILPLRIVFVPHWKYLDTAKTFRLHVPTGYTSAMFTHLPSRTVFIDTDRYINDDSLCYWMAHELGHLATNSTKESNAEKIARGYRMRTRHAQQGSLH